MLVDLKLLDISVILVEHESISLSEAKLQVRKFSAARYPADFEESAGASPEELSSIDVLAGYLQSEAAWDLDDFATPELDSPVTVHGNYGRLYEACSIVNESVPS